MTDIPEELSPTELRKEADRRELIKRGKSVLQRRAARNRVVDHILHVSVDDVKAAGAEKAIKSFLGELLSGEMSDRTATPSHIDTVGFGEMGWYDKIVGRVSPHPALMDLESGRSSEFARLSSLYKDWIDG